MQAINEAKIYIMVIAERHGWLLISETPRRCMLVFFKDGVRLAAFYNTNSIYTEMQHPCQGNTQLWRRWLDFPMMEKIFENPRYHTHGRGHHAKPGSVNIIDDEDIKKAQKWKDYSFNKKK